MRASTATLHFLRPPFNKNWTKLPFPHEKKATIYTNNDVIKYISYYFLSTRFHDFLFCARWLCWLFCQNNEKRFVVIRFDSENVIETLTICMGLMRCLRGASNELQFFVNFHVMRFKVDNRLTFQNKTQNISFEGWLSLKSPLFLPLKLF